jgi:hypothetical protein
MDFAARHYGADRRRAFLHDHWITQVEEDPEPEHISAMLGQATVAQVDP